MLPFCSYPGGGSCAYKPPQSDGVCFLKQVKRQFVWGWETAEKECPITVIIYPIGDMKMIQYFGYFWFHTRTPYDITKSDLRGTPCLILRKKPEVCLDQTTDPIRPFPKHFF